MSYKNKIDFLSLNEEVSKNLSIILNHFGIKYIYQKGIYSFPCPIHGGQDNNCRIRVTSKTCRWVCWSNHCERDCGNTIYGFICGLLKKENPEATKIDAALVCMEILDLKEEDFYGSSSNLDRINFVNMCRNNKSNHQTKKMFTRKELRNILNIPSAHFINRGYTPEILDKYDVGFCSNGNTDIRDRVVFPIYDDNHEFVIGTVSRTLKPKCPKCNRYHSFDEKCPETDFEKSKSVKWKISFDFNASETLFNYWFAKEYIKNDSTVILLEGQGDVLKLEQAGIHNSLGIFGTSLKTGQFRKLQTTGAMNVILALDKDGPGQEAQSKIEQQLRRYYNIFKADIPEGKDVGDLNEQQIKDIFLPILERINNETKNLVS